MTAAKKPRRGRSPKQKCGFCERYMVESSELGAGFQTLVCVGDNHLTTTVLCPSKAARMAARPVPKQGENKENRGKPSCLKRRPLSEIEMTAARMAAREAIR